ncbi:MAG: hypothetical protein ACPIOQ_42770 [Promethearchaeia archaeon]
MCSTKPSGVDGASIDSKRDAPRDSRRDSGPAAALAVHVLVSAA